MAYPWPKYCAYHLFDVSSYSHSLRSTKWVDQLGRIHLSHLEPKIDGNGVIQ